MKNFKWVALSILLLAGSGLFIYSVNSKPESPPEKTFNVPYVATAIKLSKMGFKNVLEVQQLFSTPEKQDWQKKGFVFYSDDEFRAILIRDKLINMPASQYAGTIPTDKQLEMIDKLDKFLATKEPAYADIPHEGDGFIISMGGFVRDPLRGMEVSTDISRIVFIAAPRETGIDPIVVVQIKGGYIELARW